MGDHRRSTHLIRHTLREVLAQRHAPQLQLVGGSQVTELKLHEVLQQALDTISDLEREDGDVLNDGQ
jgi:hypothetical protein